MKKLIILILFLTSGVTSGFSRTQPDYLDIKNAPQLAVEQYGAVGNGTTDDTTSIENAIRAAFIAKKAVTFVSGKTYYIKRAISLTPSGLDEGQIYEVNIYGNGATIQCGKGASEKLAGFTLPANINLRVLDLNLVGYRKFLTTQEYIPTVGAATPNSIEPKDPQFVFLSMDKLTSGNITFQNCSFKDIFGDALHATVNGAIKTNFESCQFNNIAWNSAYMLDHVVSSSTFSARNCIVNDIGILPSTFSVNGTPTTFDTSEFAVQTSWGFVLIGGRSEILNSRFNNYTSSVVAGIGYIEADLPGTSLLFSGNVVTSTSPLCRSNNPSAAVWSEGISTYIVTDNIIDISTRNATDSFENSAAIAVFLQASSTAIVSENHVTIGNDCVAYGIRSSHTASSTYHFLNNVISGAKLESIISNTYVSGREANTVLMTGNITSTSLSVNAADFVALHNNVTAGSNSVGAAVSYPDYVNVDGPLVIQPVATTAVVLTTSLKPGLWSVSVNLNVVPELGTATQLMVGVIASSTPLAQIDTTLVPFNDAVFSYNESSVSNFVVLNAVGIVDIRGDVAVPYYVSVTHDIASGSIGMRAKLRAIKIK